MSAYSDIILQCWRNTRTEEANASWFFKKNDIEKAAADLNISVKNVADVRYTFDSREPLPIEDYGILQVGKGSYAFVPVQNNLINADNIDSAVYLPDLVDEFTNKYLTKDEQGVLTRLYASKAFEHFSTIKNISRIQDHWRTTGKQGQIEIDSLATCEIDGKKSVLMINVKKAPDRISKTYLYNLNRLGAAKFDCPLAILNIYIYSDCAICWIPGALDSLNEIAPAETVLVKLYEKS